MVESAGTLPDGFYYSSRRRMDLLLLLRVRVAPAWLGLKGTARRRRPSPIRVYLRCLHDGVSGATDRGSRVRNPRDRGRKLACDLLCQPGLPHSPPFCLERKLGNLNFKNTPRHSSLPHSLNNCCLYYCLSSPLPPLQKKKNKKVMIFSPICRKSMYSQRGTLILSTGNTKHDSQHGKIGTRLQE